MVNHNFDLLVKLSLIPFPNPNELLKYKIESAIQNTTSAADDLRSQAKSFVSTISAEEEKAVRSFTSSYPYFARFMKKFNISGSYTLVSSFLIVSLFCFNLYLFMSGSFAVPWMNETHYCIISE